MAQASDWVEGRSFALGSIAYVLGVWVLLGEPLGMLIVVTLHLLKLQRPRKASDFPSVTSCEYQLWSIHMGFLDFRV